MKRLRWFALIATLAAGWWFWRLLPEPLFDAPLATLIEDRDGRVLGATVASDGQWRFPRHQSPPDKYAIAVMLFEDKRFRHHLGVDPFALSRATWQNLRAREVVSGASTLTMQVVRLSRGDRPRTLGEKLVEMAIALRLDLALSKDQILTHYAANAPFGGNIVGLDAAALRYFGRHATELTWAEAALLAVLPNQPALLHPGGDRALLQQKRDRLLQRLHRQGHFDQLTLDLALAEPLPPKPAPAQPQAPHLLARVRAVQGGVRLRTTLDAQLQQKTTQILERYHRRLIGNGVHNGAALVLDNHSGAVLAYAGNIGYGDGQHGQSVDLLTAKRSTGSLLKPFLYAAMIDADLLAPTMLVTDIPTRFGGYAPKNFEPTYDGAVPADQSLARSLNVPAVRMLNDYGVARFHRLLNRQGLKLDKGPRHYGLALILGGAESTAWQLATLYMNAARQIQNLPAIKPHFDGQPQTAEPHPLDPGAVYHMTQALQLVERPASQGLWRQFVDSRPVAWKTGTSFGFRDAWSIGYTPEHTVAVWVGNADGEGRPGLTGVSTAAPIMFELFRALPDSNTQITPPPTLQPTTICTQSGHPANRHCAQTTTTHLAEPATRTPACSYCQLLFLDPKTGRQVHGDCAAPSQMQATPWFVLRPGQAWFTQQRGGAYRPPPPYREDCQPKDQPTMTWVYPNARASIQLPRELNGQQGKALLEVAHGDPNATLYWYKDGQFQGETSSTHQWPLTKPGAQSWLITDDQGQSIQRQIQVYLEPVAGFFSQITDAPGKPR